MAEHRWAAVAIVGLDEEAARAFATTPDVTLLSLAGDPDLRALRGPICEDCRVSWEDVHASAKPWPCPGQRPEALGGTLINPPWARPAANRQQRRRRQREAVKNPPPRSPLAAAPPEAVARLTSIVDRALDRGRPPNAESDLRTVRPSPQEA